jgi:hypothetical protein
MQKSGNKFTSNLDEIEFITKSIKRLSDNVQSRWKVMPDLKIKTKTKIFVFFHQYIH